MNNEMLEKDAVVLIENAMQNYLKEDMTVCEGANIEYRAIFNKGKAEIKSHMSAIKRMSANPKAEDAAEFQKECKTAKDILTKMQASINQIKSTTGSAVLSWFAMSLLDFCKWIIPELLTFGLAAIVPAINQTIDFCQGIVKGMNGEDNWADSMNALKTRYLRVIGNMFKVISNAEVKFKQGVNTEKDDVKALADM